MESFAVWLFMLLAYAALAAVGIFARGIAVPVVRHMKMRLWWLNVGRFHGTDRWEVK